MAFGASGVGAACGWKGRSRSPPSASSPRSQPRWPRPESASSPSRPSTRTTCLSRRTTWRLRSKPCNGKGTPLRPAAADRFDGAGWLLSTATTTTDCAGGDSHETATPGETRTECGSLLPSLGGEVGEEVVELIPLVVLDGLELLDGGLVLLDLGLLLVEL